MTTLMVLKQCGETGLRLPGQIYQESENKAARLIAAGFVKDLQPASMMVAKEDKTNYETKQEKHTHETKRKKRK